MRPVVKIGDLVGIIPDGDEKYSWAAVVTVTNKEDDGYRGIFVDDPPNQAFLLEEVVFGGTEFPLDEWVTIEENYLEEEEAK